MPADGDLRRAAVGALVGIVAVGLAAATLTSTRDVETGVGSGERTGGGSGTFPLPEPIDPPARSLDIPFLGELFALVVILGLVATVVWVLFNRRKALRAVVAALVIVAFLYVLVRLLSSLHVTPGFPPAETGEPGMLGSDSGEGSPGGPRVRVPPFVLFVLLAVGAVAATVALARSGGDPADEPDGGVGAAPGLAAAAVGRAAGRAAERIEDGTAADNEVYRAWREMTDLLDVTSPESATPGEFADAAVAAGMAPADVDELTRLFESVRYGGAEPSAELERRAVEVFERIESGYAREEP